MSTPRTDRITTRLTQKISAGDYYEAQQQTRVAASRHLKTQNFAAAIDILSSVAQSLLRAGQGASAGDLCVMLVDVYCQAEMRPDAESKGRLLACLRLFDGAEPTRKRFIGDMISWSAKFGDYPGGDPELHHVAGSLYADEHEPYEAERHLIVGTKDSPELLARMEYAWYKEGDAHLAPHFAARAILGYLLVGNVRAANACHRVFTSALAADNAGPAVQDVASGHCDLRVFPGLPLLNFLGLLLLAVPRGAPDVYRALLAKYGPQIRDVESWDEALEQIAKFYFGISRPRQSNPLMDMMSGLFGGGGGAPQRRGLRGLEAPAPAGLD
ncbi:hypothetical protein CDD80_7094 [Ophiocordyceps camponoti-rufipedis]|uniref:DUF410 domain-containing protein n=1 Tax=Ophiocordyceps camponoti-rufipedis TaxID=2004952 RepID=A0A2C5YHJ5_9HYPO|nr:hypothetical protein CDD80_7094 [Ophiocordyceps camponoti-rufipedis]